MRSMTGFGIGEAPLSSEATSPSGKLSVEIRAVNHRYLDVRVRAPNQLPDLAGAVETLARERLTRGRFDVTVRIEASALGAVSIHKEREAIRNRLLHLEERIRLRPLVHAAVQKIMAARQIDEEHAYSILRNCAMQKRLPMEQVAASIVGGAEPLPEAG